MENTGDEMVYPSKPFIEKKNESVFRSLINILLFLTISYFYFNKDVSFVVIVFVILLLHELGHLVAMRFFKYTDLKIFFIPILGAFASGNKKEVSKKQSAIIYLCGSIPGILLGIGLYYYSLNVQSNLLYKTSYFFFLINLINLLPIKPLDGGNIISVLFIDSNKTLHRVFIVVSIITMIAVSFFLKSYILLVIPFLMINSQFKQAKVEKVKEKLLKDGVDLNLSFNDLSDKGYWRIRMEVVKSFKIFQKINPASLQISEHESKIVAHVKLITKETNYTNDISSATRKIILVAFILGLIIPAVFITTMKNNDGQKKKTLYEQLSYDQIKMMKEKCVNGFGVSLGLKLPSKNNEKFCDCFIEEILHKYTNQELEKIHSLDKQTQVDCLKIIISKCLKAAYSDKINVDSILNNRRIEKLVNENQVQLNKKKSSQR